RVRVTNKAAQPLHGAVLYAGLHRNGGIDVLAYHAVLARRATFIVSSQWRRSKLHRLLANGIFVTRRKDGTDRSGNDAALASAAAKLIDGQAVFILPEGTSALGPRPLPMQTGAARLAALALS